MTKIVAWQIFALSVVAATWASMPLGIFPNWLTPYLVPIQCMLIGCLAGVLYCMRAIYVNRGVNKAWDSHWDVWHFLRPITSAISALVAYIFLRAGVVVLEADTVDGANSYGYLAFAFVAGYNVDQFLRRIEAIAKSTFSVEPSRAGKRGEDDN